MTPVHPEILAALSAGIQSEVAAYVFYVEASKNTQAKRFAELLERLAREEKSHFHILERQHDSLVRSEKWISTADVLKMDGLPQISEDMTMQHKELIAEVRGAKTSQEILEIAYRLESEAFELFDREAARAKTPEAQKTFRELAKFEQGHMAIVSQMMNEYRD